MLNSESQAEGAFVFQSTGGFGAEMDAVANPVLGLVDGFLDKKKVPLGSGLNSTRYTSFTQAADGNIVTVENDNQTDEGIVAHYLPTKIDDVYTAELDDTAGTTTGSAIPGYYISVLTTDATLLDESTASTSQQHFQLVDNGKGQNSALHPTRGGRWVLFRVTEIQNVQTQA